MGAECMVPGLWSVGVCGEGWVTKENGRPPSFRLVRRSIAFSKTSRADRKMFSPCSIRVCGVSE